MSEMAIAAASTRIRSTREQHVERLRATEAMLTAGHHPAAVERHITQQYGCCRRQARRYIRAFRKLASHTAAEDALTIDEMLATLLERSTQAVEGEEPDYKACAKFLEQYARMRGWLDRRDKLTVDHNVTVQHVPALAGASDEEIAALAAYHDARARRLAASEPGTDQPVGNLGELSDGAHVGSPSSSGG